MSTIVAKFNCSSIKPRLYPFLGLEYYVTPFGLLKYRCRADNVLISATVFHTSTISGVAMDYNPHRGPYEAAIGALAVAQSGLKEQEELYGHLHRFDSAAAQAKLEKAQVEQNQLQAQIDILRCKIMAADTITALSQRSFAQKVVDRVRGMPVLKEPVPADLERISAHKALYEKLAAEVQERKKVVTALRHDIQFNSSLDWVEVDSDFATFRSQISRLKPAVEKLAVDIVRFDEHLSGPLRQLERCREDLTKARKSLDHAVRFDDQYQATNPRSVARKKVQVQCGQLFGIDSPTRVRELKTGQVEQLERDLTKCEKRILILQQRDTRVIGRLVVDGNNLCNRGRGKHQEFIGLNALNTVIPALIKALPGTEILLVFDPGIVRKLRLSEVEIRQQFPTEVEVYLTPRGREADELIIELAHAETAYIVSNDRYVEFEGRPPIKGNRVFSHDITQKDILINDLWISTTYAPPEGKGVGASS